MTTLNRALRAHQTGDLKVAEAEYRKTLRVDPGQVDALYLFGLLLHQTGRSRNAVEYLVRAIRANGKRAEFSNTLGDVYRVLGQTNDAVLQFEQSLALRPGFIEALVNLALTLNAANRKQDALVLLFDALGKDLSVAGSAPHAPLRQLLATVLSDVVLNTGNAVVSGVLRVLCTDERIAAQMLAGSVFGLLKSHPEYANLRAALAAADASGVAVAPTASATILDHFSALANDSLISSVLPRVVVTDADVEQMLCGVRRHLQLAATISPQGLGPRECELAFMIAAQCFNTEYVWDVNAHEVACTRTLCGTIEAWLQCTDNQVARIESALLGYAMYGSLSDLQGWEQLAEVPMERWSDYVRPLIDTQIHQHVVERDIANALLSLTTVTDATSQVVRAQYEANPYPRWLSLQETVQTTVAAFVRARRPASAVATAHSARPRILVAGSGTGQQPLHMARTFPDATIVAMDLSRTSLAYGARMASRLGFTNVEFVHGDLLELDGTALQFDMVSCSGVLHHLRDPMQGWARLVDVLAPNGIMKIGLYSTSARQGINAARDIAEQIGVRADADADAASVRHVRDAVKRLPDGHPARQVLTIQDFYSVSGCRDLLLHVQERSYTIDEIATSLSALGLTFLEFQLPQAVQTSFKTEFPDVASTRDLQAWLAFEAKHPRTFAGMYQFWCARG